jgi:hypothetical protein
MNAIASLGLSTSNSPNCTVSSNLDNPSTSAELNAKRMRGTISEFDIPPMTANMMEARTLLGANDEMKDT